MAVGAHCPPSERLPRPPSVLRSQAPAERARAGATTRSLVGHHGPSHTVWRQRPAETQMSCTSSVYSRYQAPAAADGVTPAQVASDDIGHAAQHSLPARTRRHPRAHKNSIRSRQDASQHSGKQKSKTEGRGVLGKGRPQTKAVLRPRRRRRVSHGAAAGSTRLAAHSPRRCRGPSRHHSVFVPSLFRGRGPSLAACGRRARDVRLGGIDVLLPAGVVSDVRGLYRQPPRAAVIAATPAGPCRATVISEAARALHLHARCF